MFWLFQLLPGFHLETKERRWKRVASKAKPDWELTDCCRIWLKMSCFTFTDLLRLNTDELNLSKHHRDTWNVSSDQAHPLILWRWRLKVRGHVTSHFTCWTLTLIPRMCQSTTWWPGSLCPKGQSSAWSHVQSRAAAGRASGSVDLHWIDWLSDSLKLLLFTYLHFTPSLLHCVFSSLQFIFISGMKTWTAQTNTIQRILNVNNCIC